MQHLDDHHQGKGCFSSSFFLAGVQAFSGMSSVQQSHVQGYSGCPAEPHQHHWCLLLCHHHSYPPALVLHQLQLPVQALQHCHHHHQQQPLVAAMLPLCQTPAGCVQPCHPTCSVTAVWNLCFPHYTSVTSSIAVCVLCGALLQGRWFWYGCFVLLWHHLFRFVKDLERNSFLWEGKVSARVCAMQCYSKLLLLYWYSTHATVSHHHLHKHACACNCTCTVVRSQKCACMYWARNSHSTLCELETVVIVTICTDRTCAFPVIVTVITLL